MSDLQLLLLTRTTCHAGHRYPDCAGEQAACPQGTPHRSVASRTDPESRALSLGGFSRTTTRDLQLGVKHPKEQRGPARTGGAPGGPHLLAPRLPGEPMGSNRNSDGHSHRL